MRTIVVGTRRSRLARIQTAAVVDRLRRQHPDLDIEEQIVATSGDRLPDVPADQAGVVGLFTSELEHRLLDGTIDLAVHSCKDLPTSLAQGCAIAAVPEREAPDDALVAAPGMTLDALPAGARVGTGSARRAALLRRARPDVVPAPIRGNVDTRLAKLDRGDYGALILAAAGLRRLGCADRIAAALGPDSWYHAVAQGALAVESRADDEEVLELLCAVDDPEVHRVVEAERGFLRRLGGGCHVAAGVRSQVEGDCLRLAGMVAGAGGEPFITAEVAGPLDEAGAVGVGLAEHLLADGAEAILRSAG